MKTDLVLDALEQALWVRSKPKGAVHTADLPGLWESIEFVNNSVCAPVFVISDQL